MPDKPLSGLKVLDCSQILAGPYCAMLLADMGADVIKIEKPNGGDDARRMGPPFIKGESAAFLMINRNKRSLCLNLKSDAGIDVFLRLAAEVDVLVENFRPGGMEKLGLGYEKLSGVNPGLIYCKISGFGTTGPYRKRGGFDLVAQGMSGLMSVTGHAGHPPVKVGVPITDINAAMYACYGVLCAAVHRMKTGEGQLVDTSLLEGGIAYTLWESAIFFASGKVPVPEGSRHRLSAPYQAFATRNGYITVGAANQANWEKMAQAIGREDLLQDERFGSNPARMVNLDALEKVLEKTFRTQTTEHWLQSLLAAGVPCGPINDMKQVYDDPHVQERNMAVECDHPVVGQVKHIGIPVKLSRTPGEVAHAAPTLGQHTDEVLREFSFGGDEIADLRSSRTVE